MSDLQTLSVANRISIWLNNQKGFDKYMRLYPNNPGYFLHFDKADRADEAFHELDEALEYLKKKIYGEPVDERYGYALTQKVKPNGMAGAVYTYAEPQIQNEGAITMVIANIKAIAQAFAAATGSKYNEVPQSQSSDKYLFVTIDLPKTKVVTSTADENSETTTPSPGSHSHSQTDESAAANEAVPTEQ